MEAIVKSIGYISTPYNTIEECPINIDPTNGPLCKLIIDDDYKDGLSGLEAGHEILILYWFENTDRNLNQQTSGNGKSTNGTFTLRSPHRPNPIAATVLPIEAIENGKISVKGLDCLNGAHLLDIKPEK